MLRITKMPAWPTSTRKSVLSFTLAVTVTAKVKEKTLFLAEVGQAGIFVIRNIPATDLDPILGIACPNILYPYVREVVSDVVGRAGFPPVVLSPVNFEGLYQAQKQAQDEQKAAEPVIQVAH